MLFLSQLEVSFLFMLPACLQLVAHPVGRAKITQALTRPTFLSTMPRWKSILFLLCPSLGSIALIPQGLVPLLIKLSGSSSRVWFLALYLPTAWQWPVIVSMLLLGLGILGAMIPLYLSHKKVWQRLQTEKGFIAALRKDTVEQQENELN